MEILGEQPAWSMTDSEKLSRLDATVAELHRLETYYLQLIADLDASGYARELGAGDTARFLSTRYRLDSAQARHDLRLATTLPKYDAVADALADPARPFEDQVDAGEAAADETATVPGLVADSNRPGPRHERPVTPAQAAAIVSALEKVSASVPVEDVQAAARQLVKLARTFTPRELRAAGDRMRNVLDTDGPEPDEQRAYHRESLTLHTAEKGVRFRGYLANENAELLRTLVHAGAKPRKTCDDQPDPRSRDKRQADALSNLLSTAAAVIHTSGGTPTSSDSTSADHTTTTAADALNAAPTEAKAADAITREATNAEAATSPATAARMPRSGAGTVGPRPGTGDTSTGGDPAGGYFPGHGPKAHLTVTIDYDSLRSAAAGAIGDAVFGDGLSAATVRRLACDAQVIPVVLGSKSQPLDVGTTRRLVTGPMRLALNARDRGCVVCGAPPIQCEAHHLVHWVDGGDTAVGNLVLLCKRHHLDLHSGHWHIEIVDEVVHVSRPDWATPAQVLRDHYQPARYDISSAATSAPRSPTRAPDLGAVTSPGVARLAIWGARESPVTRPRPPTETVGPWH
ncbi:DUF222 domain-containing protein [Kribbella sp. NPDC050820]|uniref:HNH endonuclease signature motif containing protein n=1 Tax=Kribbella sp. NPDC050820 TaxID=3155408 RepID=UPI00340ACE83